MHRARASEVRGNKVLVDGAWLTCSGNRSVYPTDVLSGIPILRCAWKDNKALTRYYYAKGKLRDLGFGKDGGWMVSRGGHFAFFDAEMD